MLSDHGRGEEYLGRLAARNKVDLMMSGEMKRHSLEGSIIAGAIPVLAETQVCLQDLVATCAR